MSGSLRFGDKITVKAYIVRRKDRSKRYWQRIEFDQPKRALFLGYRTFANGTVTQDYEDGPYFSGEEFVKGAWICREEKGRGSKPQKVLAADCDLILITAPFPEPPSAPLFELRQKLQELIELLPKEKKD